MLNPNAWLCHYDIPGVTEDRFRRVPLERRPTTAAAVLTHASVLSLTSDGTRHRPVHRGVWFSESILGRVPPPSPPANVEPIEPTPVDAREGDRAHATRGARERPELRGVPRAKTDPLGFAFENYDAIGRWRTEEHVPTGVGANPPVDASGELPDGRSFSTPTEFQALLLDDIDRFNAAFVEKLATYALRRPMGVDDRDQLERIASAAAARDYRLRDLVQALVLSDLFQGR